MSRYQETFTKIIVSFLTAYQITHYLHKDLPALEALELFGCNVTNEIVRLLAPKEGGIGLSYLGLTDCNGVDTELLKNELASRYIFSSFVSDETFVGYRPLESEMELRKEAHTSYIQRLASTNIQRMVRGLLVRVGIYRAKKNAWHGEPSRMQWHQHSYLINTSSDLDPN